MCFVYFGVLLVCFGVFRCVSVCFVCFVCFGVFWFVLVCFGLFWFVYYVYFVYFLRFVCLCLTRTLSASVRLCVRCARCVRVWVYHRVAQSQIGGAEGTNGRTQDNVCV